MQIPNICFFFIIVLSSNNVSNASNVNVTNGSNSNSNSTLAVTPKIEPSPPEHYERQTVLMWGASNHNNSTNRSPTPTSNGLYPTDANHMKLPNQIDHNSNPQSASHLKWSESQSTSKDLPVSAGVPIYQIHSHATDAASVAVDTSSMYAQVAHSPHLSHHSASSSTSGSHIVSPDHTNNSTTAQNHHQQQTIGSSCEVWSPAYSQYQYFTYHHHANTQ